MMQATELSNDHIIRSLRIYVTDLTAEVTPFPKNAEYFKNLAGWIACAATRIEKLSGSNVDQPGVGK